MVDFSDQELAHRDALPVYDMEAAIARLDEAVAFVIGVARQYLAALGFEQRPLRIPESDVRVTYGHAWVSPDDEIPPELLEG